MSYHTNQEPCEYLISASNQIEVMYAEKRGVITKNLVGLIARHIYSGIWRDITTTTMGMQWLLDQPIINKKELSTQDYVINSGRNFIENIHFKCHDKSFVEGILQPTLEEHRDAWGWTTGGGLKKSSIKKITTYKPDETHEPEPSVDNSTTAIHIIVP
jgi:hypothetical protein